MFLAGGGMDETKAVGMEAEAAQGVVAAAVFLVADDGMAEVLGVDADLVLASCLKMEVHQRVIVVANQHLVMGHGVFPAVVNGAGVSDEGFVVFEPRLHGARAGFQPAFHDGHVAAVIHFLLPVLLEHHGDLLVFGEEHQSRGIAVEAVDGVGPAALLGGGEILVEDALGGLLFGAGAIGEEPFFFVDDHEMLVLIYDFEPFAVESFFGGGFTNLDGHAGLQGEVELGSAVAIHADDAVGQHPFNFAAADAVHLFHDELYQRRFFCHLELKRVAF